MKNLLKNILKNSTQIFFFICGNFIIILYIYSRFVLNRLPRSLQFINIEDNSIIINVFTGVLACIFCSVFLLLVIITTKKLLNIPFTFNNKLIQIFIQFIENSLYTVYNLLCSKIDNLYFITRPYIIGYHNLFYNKLRLLLGMNYIFFSVSVVCFVIDVFWFFKLEYFYKTLMWLCIPLLHKLWLFNIKEWIKVKEQIEEFVIVNKEATNKHDVFSFLPKEGKVLDETMFNFYSKEYCNIIALENFIQNFNKVEEYYNPRFYIIIYSLYLIGWIYVLIKNIFIL